MTDTQRLRGLLERATQKPFDTRNGWEIKLAKEEFRDAAEDELPALLDRIDALEAALRPFAEKQTTDELLNDPKPSEWPGTTLKRRVEILGEGVRKHNAEILAARAALQETQR